MGNCCGKREVIVLNTSKRPQMRRRRSSIFRENITKLTDYKKKYDYISLIGNGGFGKVRLFRDRNFKTLKYAIKTIKKDLLNTHNIQCIVDEVKILRSVDHPNIVKYFETYEEDNIIHIVMEYIPGQNLYELVHSRNKLKKRFSEHEICQLISYILKAILFLHRSNIIHRDLKPENILISNPEDLTSVKIIDFGLSVLNKKDEKYRVGSPYYMAPEMIEGNYSKASDMWSIGVIMYLIMTGRQPFEGVDQRDVYRNILKGNYDKKVLKDDKFSIEIRDFVEKLLVVKESQRMKSDAAFDHSWISKFSGNASTAIVNESIIESLRSFSKNNILQKEILFYLAKISNESEINGLKKAFDGLDINNTGVIELSQIENVFKNSDIKVTPVITFFIIFIIFVFYLFYIFFITSQILYVICTIIIRFL